MIKIKVLLCLFTVFCIQTVVFAGHEMITGEHEALTGQPEVLKEETDYLVYGLPFVEHIDNSLDMVSNALPVNFIAEVIFMSHWIDEGANAAPHDWNIHQYYTASIPIGDIVSIGYNFFSASFTDAVPETLERDHTIFAEFAVGPVTLIPMWTYVDIPEGEPDSEEVGLEVSVDTFLNPTLIMNYDYHEEKGYYFEGVISHDFEFGKFGVLTPNMAMGLNSRKGTEHTYLTHIDFGVDYTMPLGRHTSVTGFLHMTKGLKENDGYEDVIPWGGMSILFEL